MKNNFVILSATLALMTLGCQNSTTRQQDTMGASVPHPAPVVVDPSRVKTAEDVLEVQTALENELEGILMVIRKEYSFPQDDYLGHFKNEMNERDSILEVIKKSDPTTYLSWHIAAKSFDTRTMVKIQTTCPSFKGFKDWEDAWHSSPEYQSQGPQFNKLALARADSARAEYDRKLKIAYDAIGFDPNNICQ